jgi:hypothetical protein
MADTKDLTDKDILKYWQLPQPVPVAIPKKELTLREAAQQALEAMEYFKVLTVQVDRATAQRSITDLEAALRRAEIKDGKRAKTPKSSDRQ